MKGSEVRVENADKKFGDFHALKNVSLTIKKGEFFSLLGPSGCGKTTLLRIIAGFEDPTGGAVYLDDTDVLPLPPDKRHVNTVFQNYALFPHLTVFENIAFPLRLKKVPFAQIKERVTRYLKLVHLLGQENKKPNQLSGGQKQRVAIARALINEPSVLLLDEPLSALDEELRDSLGEEILRIQRASGVTAVVVSHSRRELARLATETLELRDGRLDPRVHTF